MEVSKQLHAPAALPWKKHLWVPIVEQTMQSREQAPFLESLATVLLPCCNGTGCVGLSCGTVSEYEPQRAPLSHLPRGDSVFRLRS